MVQSPKALRQRSLVLDGGAEPGAIGFKQLYRSILKQSLAHTLRRSHSIRCRIHLFTFQLADATE